MLKSNEICIETHHAGRDGENWHTSKENFDHHKITEGC